MTEMRDPNERKPESRTSFIQRLKRMNKWDQVEAEKEQIRRELRERGMHRNAAHDECWRRIMEKYPRPVEITFKKKPPPVGNGKYKDIPSDPHNGIDVPTYDDVCMYQYNQKKEEVEVYNQLAREEQREKEAEIPTRFTTGNPDLVQDILFAYENIHANPREVSAPPGRGSMSLLRWAKQHENEFFKQLVPLALRMLDKRTEVADDPYADAETHDAEIDEMLRDVLKKSKERGSAERRSLTD